VTLPSSPHGLARKSLGSPGLSVLGISASAPMTVVAGAVIATFAATGVVGVPLAFILLTVPLLLVSVGLVAMSRDMAHTGAFYAFLARGLGRSWGLSAAIVALVAYNAIQICLYGLFGATVADILKTGTWWEWAAAVWLIVALLGIRHIEVNTRVIAIVLAIEIAVIGMLIAAALTHPAAATSGSSSMTALKPSALFTNGVGVVLAFTVASFVGFESVIAYREEAHDWRAVRRAAIGAVLFLGAFYALASWSLTITVGPAHIIDATRDPSAGLPFSILEVHYGPFWSGLGQAVLITSIFGALISFHNVVARYTFGLAREGVLPARLGIIGGSIGGVPIGGSIAQSVTAAITILIFMALHADPITALFTLLSVVAAIGVLLLMIGAAFAVIRFYRLSPNAPGRWHSLTAPGLGAAGLIVILAITSANLTALTGQATQARWLLPGVVLAAAVGGAAWALVLRARRPGVYMAIGYGDPKPLAVLDRSLAHLEL
jgi:amino acid transporter